MLGFLFELWEFSQLRWVLRASPKILASRKTHKNRMKNPNELRQPNPPEKKTTPTKKNTINPSQVGYRRANYILLN